MEITFKDTEKGTVVVDATLTLEELQEAVMNYLKDKRSQYEYDEENIIIDTVTKARAVPGMDPHDCDYVYDLKGINIKF